MLKQRVSVKPDFEALRALQLSKSHLRVRIRKHPERAFLPSGSPYSTPWVYPEDTELGAEFCDRAEEKTLSAGPLQQAGANPPGANPSGANPPVANPSGTNPSGANPSDVIQLTARTAGATTDAAPVAPLTQKAKRGFSADPWLPQKRGYATLEGRREASARSSIQNPHESTLEKPEGRKGQVGADSLLPPAPEHNVGTKGHMENHQQQNKKRELLQDRADFRSIHEASSIPCATARAVQESKVLKSSAPEMQEEVGRHRVGDEHPVVNPQRALLRSKQEAVVEQSLVMGLAASAVAGTVQRLSGQERHNYRENVAMKETIGPVHEPHELQAVRGELKVPGALLGSSKELAGQQQGEVRVVGEGPSNGESQNQPAHRTGGFGSGAAAIQGILTEVSRPAEALAGFVSERRFANGPGSTRRTTARTKVGTPAPDKKSRLSADGLGDVESRLRALSVSTSPSIAPPTLLPAFCSRSEPGPAATSPTSDSSSAGPPTCPDDQADAKASLFGSTSTSRSWGGLVGLSPWPHFKAPAKCPICLEPVRRGTGPPLPSPGKRPGLFDCHIWPLTRDPCSRCQQAIGSPMKTPEPSSKRRKVVLSTAVNCGDSLWGISRRLTGSGANWRELVKANPQYFKCPPPPHRSPVDSSQFVIKPGWVLKVPAIVPVSSAQNER